MKHDRHILRPLLVVALLLGSLPPAAAIDSITLGQGIRLLGWRNIADWGAVERVTVTYDSLFMWDVSAGDNLAPGLLRRGGRVFAIYEEVQEDSLVEITGPLPNLEYLVDGNGATAFNPDRAGETGVPRGLRVVLDLGAPFSINRIRLHPRLDEDNRIRFPQQFTVGTATGETYDTSYLPVSQLNFSEILPNAEPIVDRVFASREARYVQITLAPVQPWELAEIEIYGDGTVPVGTFQSIPIPARHSYPVWGKVRYEGGDIGDLPVVMQTRTGPDRSPTLYYRFTGVGDDVEEVAASVWNAIPEEERGPVQPNPEWSSWATVSESTVRSTALHRYIQLRFRFSEPGTIIRQLVLEYAQPALVERLQAEIHPRLVAPGTEQSFSLSVLSHTFSSNRDIVAGFRQLEVLTGARVHAVDRVLVDDVEVPFSASYTPGESFRVNLGRRIDQDGTFLQIHFRATLYRDATRFETRATEVRFTDGQVESVYQTAEPADIDIDSPGGELVVRLETDEDLEVIGDVLPSSTVLTPNGDGLNDEIRFAFDLFKLTRTARVQVTIHDLAGREVARLLDEELPGGHREVVWGGLDEDGHAVAPGTYLYRVRVDGDEGRRTRQGVLGVVY